MEYTRTKIVYNTTFEEVLSPGDIAALRHKDGDLYIVVVKEVHEEHIRGRWVEVRDNKSASSMGSCNPFRFMKVDYDLEFFVDKNGEVHR